MQNCGDCTLCCTTCNIEELKKPSGTECIHCSIKCDIYENRPDSCKDFKCAYIQMEKVSVLMRPDNLGVVFEKIADDLMFGIVNSGHSDFKHMKGQINAFLNSGINVVIMKNNNPIVYHLDNVSPESLLKRVHCIASK